MPGFGGQISPPLNAPSLEPLTVGVTPGPNSLITTSNRVIIFGASGGLFVYTPTPAANTLAASVTGQAVTDPFGNHALAGETSYTNASTTPAAPPWTAINISGVGLTSYLSSVLGQNGTWTSQGAITFRAASSPQLVLPSGFTGIIPATQSDSTTVTATTTAVITMTKQWDIPANDAAANTIYRLTVFGNGVTAPANVNLASWVGDIGAVSIIGLSLTAAGLPAAFTFDYVLVINFQCTVAGASGNFNASAQWLLTNHANATADYASAIVDTGNTVDTTADHKLTWQWQWSTVTGGPTISAYGSILERISG